MPTWNLSHIGDMVAVGVEFERSWVQVPDQLTETSWKRLRGSACLHHLESLKLHLLCELDSKGDRYMSHAARDPQLGSPRFKILI